MMQKYVAKKDFSSFTSSKIGDSFKIWFWHNDSCENWSLQEAFPKLFSNLHSKDVSVTSNLHFFNGSE